MTDPNQIYKDRAIARIKALQLFEETNKSTEDLHKQNISKLTQMESEIIQNKERIRDKDIKIKALEEKLDYVTKEKESYEHKVEILENQIRRIYAITNIPIILRKSNE